MYEFIGRFTVDYVLIGAFLLAISVFVHAYLKRINKITSSITNLSRLAFLSVILLWPVFLWKILFGNGDGKEDPTDKP